MEMFRYVKENVDPHDDGSIKDYLNKMLDREAETAPVSCTDLATRYIPCRDPRAVLLKKYARHMAEIKGYAEDFDLLQRWRSWVSHSYRSAERATRQCAPTLICIPASYIPCSASRRTYSRRCSPLHV